MIILSAHQWLYFVSVMGFTSNVVQPDSVLALDHGVHKVYFVKRYINYDKVRTHNKELGLAYEGEIYGAVFEFKIRMMFYLHFRCM